MTTGKKFAEIRNRETGETLVEMIVPGRDEDAVSVSLRLLTQQLIAKGHGEAGGGVFGGAYGYGVDFENDVFEMHRDRQDYDCTCGAAEPKHADTCDQVTKRRAWLSARMDFACEHKTDAQRDAEIEKSVKRGLSRRMAILGACSSTIDFSKFEEYEKRYPFPPCTCGVDVAWVESDTHARDCQRSIAERPNFYHKPSGAVVSWYKYIGRDNEIEVGSNVSLREVLEGCLRSIGVESLEVAAREYAEAEREAAEAADRAMRFWTTDEDAEV